MSYLGQVATRSYVPGDLWGGGVYTQFNSRSAHRASDDITSLQLLFPNWCVSGGSEIGGGLGTVTITASIEYPAATFTQVTFDTGSAGSTIAEGANKLSDEIAVAIPDGDWFWVRVYMTGAVGQGVTLIVDTALGDRYEKAASGLSDKTMGGTITTDGSGHNYMPVAIIGQTTKPTVLVVGDSRVVGFYTDPSSGDRGNTAPSVGAAGFGYITLGIGGEKAQSFVASHAKRLALAAYCTNVVLEYGINDLNEGRTDAQLQADLNTILGYFTQPVWLTTMEPVSSSSGDWSTLIAQTTAAYNSVRVANNNWRRTTPTGFAGYFEIADVVESARDSGLWKVSGGALTADGVHLYPASSEDVVRDSGAIDADVFVGDETPPLLPNINTANFRLSFGTSKRTFGDRLDDLTLSVKDFGAVGDGDADDTDALQLACDTLFGPYGAVHAGDGDGVWLNRNLHFPPGDYKISYPLMLNQVHGARFIGAGSHQTRIFWDPGEPRVADTETISGSITVSASNSAASLIEARTVQYMAIEGMTLDASGVQDVVYRLMTYPPVWPNGGTGGSYRDVHFTNAAVTGFLAGGQDDVGAGHGYNGSTLCSEQTFVKCRITNCPSFGARIAHQNALNLSFISTYFANCGVGYSAPQGGAGTFNFCRFENNVLDIYSLQAMITVIGCDSTSENFTSTGGTLIGNRHFPATTGVSACLSGTTLPLSGPPFVESGTDTGRVVLIGNHLGVNAFLADHTGAPPADPHRVHLLGNLLDNPDCFDELNITVGEGVVTCREDGVLVTLP